MSDDDDLRQVGIRVEFAWWLAPYLNTLVFFCLLCQREPDWGKLGLVINRALRVKVAR